MMMIDERVEKWTQRDVCYLNAINMEKSEKDDIMIMKLYKSHPADAHGRLAPTRVI